MMLGARTAAWSGKQLPYLRRVACLQSTGTQYIDAPIHASSELSIDIVFENSGTPTVNSNPLGAILTSPRMRHHLNFDNVIGGLNYYFINGDSLVKLNKSVADGNRIHLIVDAENHLISAEDELGKIIASVDQGYGWDTGINYRLFARAGVEYYAKIKIYGAKLWDGKKNISLIPVLDLSGRPAMYDEVSEQFFYNQGTGEFTWGELET